ncbi:DUF389 domain-containing protein [Microbulbifer yueqingensis]|uniref:Uncharacterized hydrophobic domain-containing protein n=1 Tax=Microbulbifer yueqingensis TaxID=658219 RepID=A0A1G8ZU41_9GAMM|nr:DUF389 domain-containing protein [Microbulbifer yueqingensis]SDK17865.1 uncharacterized hydrophobic domain-containing protein [Microbulbifer yueqingensis]
MAVLALLRNADEISQVIPWAAEIALSRNTALHVLGWHYAAAPIPDGEFSNRTIEAALGRFLRKLQRIRAISRLEEPGNLEVFEVGERDADECAIAVAQREDIELIVAAAPDQTGATGATLSSSTLLKKGRCSTVILFGGAKRSRQPGKVFVSATDSAHDGAALVIAHQLAECGGGEVTLARQEADYEEVDIEVGLRDLRKLLRDTGLESSTRIHCRVLNERDVAANAQLMDAHDLVLLAANSPLIASVVELTRHPTVAVAKRAPALRPWRHAVMGEYWNPFLSPADYADLLETLRRGSMLTLDFLVMLGLSTVVASMGLLQDSPAVVIGSMLLAPLMTPMLGCGLALVQANPRLGNTALQSVAAGLLLTVVISLAIGMLTPGVELTPEIYARGAPNVLDLVIAGASGAAAAYASARPNLVGSIAGVAIATALVPPLCSIGISLAYYELGNAIGAALLFLTNFVAIVLFAAATFRLMGVRTSRTRRRQRRWVAGTVAVLAIVALVLLGPLKVSLVKGLLQGKPQPNSYPLSASVIEALKDYVEENPDVEILSAGRPASPHHPSDVVLVLAAPFELDKAYGRELIRIVREEMRQPDLKVEVHCLRELWQEKSR